MPRKQQRIRPPSPNRRIQARPTAAPLRPRSRLRDRHPELNSLRRLNRLKTSSRLLPRDNNHKPNSRAAARMHPSPRHNRHPPRLRRNLLPIMCHLLQVFCPPELMRQLRQSNGLPGGCRNRHPHRFPDRSPDPIRFLPNCLPERFQRLSQAPRSDKNSA